MGGSKRLPKVPRSVATVILAICIMYISPLRSRIPPLQSQNMKFVTEATRADIFYPQIDFHWILVEEHHLYKFVTICINMVGLCIKTLFAGQISLLKLCHILIFWTKLVTLLFETNLKSARPEPGLRLSHFSSGVQYSRLGQMLLSPLTS